MWARAVERARRRPGHDRCAGHGAISTVPRAPGAAARPLRAAGPAISEATFKPCWFPLLMRMLRNSDEELAVIWHCAAIGDEMARAMLEVARPGIGESEIFAAGMDVAFRRGTVAPHMLLSSGAGVRLVGAARVGIPAAGCAHDRGRRRDLGGGIQLVRDEGDLASGSHRRRASAPDIDEAATAARAAYDAGLARLRPGHTFGDVAKAMLDVIAEAGGWNVHHSLNPYGAVCGFGAGLRTFAPAQDYGGLGEVPNIGFELPLAAGMTFAMEPTRASMR